MAAFLHDLRYAARMLLKNPGLAAISIVALGLGLGLTTTMWSITYGALLRGLPFEDDEQLIHIERKRPSQGIESMGVPIHDYAAYRESQRSFTDIAAFYTGTVNISGDDGRPERFSGGFVSPSTFRLLKVQPLLGRMFTEDEGRPGAAPVIILGYTMWQNRYEGDSGIVGRAIRANGVTSEVAGVMPRDFKFPLREDVWLPLKLDPVALPWGQGNQMEVFGRLRDGGSQEAALREFELIAGRLAQEHPKENEGVGVIMKPFTEEFIGKEPIIMLWTMMGAVFAVLLIACSNVANLLLARAALRTKEVAIRTALGASRWRVVAQLLTESLLLSATGAVLGLVIALFGVKLFNAAIADTQPPFWIHIAVDGPALLFVTGITMLAALICGVLPAIQTTRANVHDVLKDENRGSSSLRLGRFAKGLVAAEIALSCGLLIAAGFMIQSVVQLRNFDYGVETGNVFTSRIGLFESTYPDSASRQRFWDELVRRLEAQPGHRGVALATVLPGLEGWNNNFAVEGATYATDRDYPSTRWVNVTPGYFPMFGITAVEGRTLSTADIGGTLPVAVVTRNWASRFSPGASPLGKRVRLGGAESTRPWLTIVGVVPDVYYQGSDDETPEVMFTAIAQGDFSFLSVVMATTGSPMAMAEVLRNELAAMDRDQPTYFTRTLEEAIEQNTWFYGVFGTLFMVFGFAALFLATVGVYGVMSFSVSRRTQEVGVRMALGAVTGDVLKLFLKQGAIQVGIGVVLGLGLAFALSSGIRFVMFQVDINNPVMYAGVTAVLVLTGLLATLLPARRATRVDPMVALRYE